MKKENLKVFATQLGISEKTLKRRFRDCIYRLGRQSFIDVDAFDKAFAERSIKSSDQPTKITKINSSKRIQFQIERAKVRIRKKYVEFDNLDSAATEAVDKNAKALLVNKARRVKIGIRQDETLLQKLQTKFDKFIEREAQELLALEKASVGTVGKNK